MWKAIFNKTYFAYYIFIAFLIIAIYLFGKQQINIQKYKNVISQQQDFLQEQDKKITEGQQFYDKCEVELESERNDLLALTAWSYKYKRLDKVLQETASKDWKNGKPTPCTGATKDLQTRLDKLGIISVKINGELIKGCSKDECYHQVIGVLFEPQNSKIIMKNGFKPTQYIFN